MNCFSFWKIIDLSSDTDFFPGRCKIDKTKPILKNGDPKIRIIEKLINNRLLTYLSIIDFLFAQQYSFRKFSDSESAFTFEIISKIQLQLYSKIICGMLSLDLLKTFDKGNNSIICKTKKSLRIVSRGAPQGSVLGPT